MEVDMDSDEKNYSGLLSDDGPYAQTAQQTIDEACALAVSIADDSMRI
jgi:hypothetical protein